MKITDKARLLTFSRLLDQCEAPVLLASPEEPERFYNMMQEPERSIALKRIAKEEMDIYASSRYDNQLMLAFCLNLHPSDSKIKTA